ncbi:MAG: hypothetical protein AB7P40_14025 [Chloroflexota bacterium]
MPIHMGTSIRPRVLLVSDDDQYSAALKQHLPDLDVMSLPESSVWVTIRAGLDVTRGSAVVMLDRGVSGRLQLRLYEVLRPADGVSRVPIIFVRSRLTAASGGFDHVLDNYQPEDATLEQTGRLVAHVMGLTSDAAGGALEAAGVPAGVSARLAATAPRTSPAPATSRVYALGPGTVQRAGLWGVALALIGFTFWPLIGSGPIRDVVFGPLKSLSGSAGNMAEFAARPRATR